MIVSITSHKRRIAWEKSGDEEIEGLQLHKKESHLGVVTNVLDCDIGLSRFKLQLHYYIHFRTKTFGNSVTAIFYKDGFGIK